MSREMIYVHSIRMAGWLMYNGYMHDDIVSNKKIKNKLVYVFSDEGEIRRIMSSIPGRAPCTTTTDL